MTGVIGQFIGQRSLTPQTIFGLLAPAALCLVVAAVVYAMPDSRQAHGDPA